MGTLKQMERVQQIISEPPNNLLRNNLPSGPLADYFTVRGKSSAFQQLFPEHCITEPEENS